MMQAIVFCDKKIDFLPVRDCPEALLPLCNIPMLQYLLEYLQEKGFRNAVLLGAEESVRNLADGLHLHMPVQYAHTLASLHADTPTLLMRRLCVPDWDMGELFTCCGNGAVTLLHPDGTRTFAELHPQGSVLLEPEQTSIVQECRFVQIGTPAAYRQIQQKLLEKPRLRKARIGTDTRISRSAAVDNSSIIGNACIIHAGAVLERCVLGDGVQIGEQVHLTDCVICRKALIDNHTKLENAVIPEGTALQSDMRQAQKKQHLVLPEDGICEGLPRWNTADTALKAGAAVATVSSSITIGYQHTQAECFALAAAAGAVSQGASVWFAGKCALSQLIAVAAFTQADTLLWIQGTQVMQIRPFCAGGLPLTEAQSRHIWQALEADTCKRVTAPGRFCHAQQLLSMWEDACRKWLPACRTSCQLHISCADTALRTCAQKLLADAGYTRDTGHPENAGNHHTGRITVSLSEDGTGISLFSAATGMIRQEQLLLISLFSFRESGEALVLPADFHPAAEDFATQHQAKILRLSPEQPSPAMLDMYQKQAVCTDGIRLLAHVLRTMEIRQQPLAELVKLLPQLCTVQHEITTPLTRQHIEKLQKINPDSRIQIVMPPQSKLVKLRVHADSMETAAEICGFWEKKLQEKNHFQNPVL